MIFYNLLSNTDHVWNLSSVTDTEFAEHEDEGYYTKKRINWKASSSFSAQAEISTIEITDFYNHICIYAFQLPDEWK